ncbi:MAG: TonB-dependent receptor, partial [Acidobacteria bacterium]|nr:TonB-dependent receptor [Acidobacteriota bacterium]
MTFKKCFLGMAVLALVFSAQAFSQTASLGGIVTDASGGVLPGAKITVTNTATGIEQVVTTNAAGVYAIPGLQVGTYKVSAAMTGFQTQTKTDLRVGAVAQLRVNFELAVAAREDTVQVSVAMENALLESSSSVGVMLPEEKLHELPVVGSNVLDLI